MRPLLLGSLFLITQLASGQAPPVEWAMSFGSRGDDRGNSIATDRNGNSIVVGRFRSSKLKLGATMLTNADSTSADLFIVKLSPQGEVLWATSAGGKGDDDATNCQTDKLGNVVVVGWFECAALRFGSFSLPNAAPGKGCDFFVAKFSPAGDCLWARSAGGSGADGDYSACAIDGKNDIVVAGTFDSPIMNFGAGNLANSGKSDAFVVKYAADGTFRWAQRAAGSGHDEGQGCSVDGKGNVFFSGFFNSPTLTFDKTVLVNSGSGSPEVFIASYSVGGEALWAKSLGGSSTDIGNGFADPSGNVAVAGVFASPTLVVGADTLTNAGDGDVFVAKLDKAGRPLWAKSAGGSSLEGARNLFVAPDGRIYVTGSYVSPVLRFGADTLRNIDATSEDIFLVSYSADGKQTWATGAGGSGRNCGRGVTCDARGNVFLAGSFEEGALRFGATTLKNAGSADVFIVKFRRSPAAKP